MTNLEHIELSINDGHIIAIEFDFTFPIEDEL